MLKNEVVGLLGFILESMGLIDNLGWKLRNV